MSYQMTRIEPGMQYGRLTVLGRDHTSGRKTFYRCSCECGKEAIVSGYNLKTGKTRSCGCLRASSVVMVRGHFDKVEVTERQKAWIIRHYKHTKNKDIKDKYGLTDGWLHRFARKNGLKKSPQFMKACQEATTKAAAFSHRINNSYPPKGHRIPGSEQLRFQKGVSNLERWGKKREEERVRKSAESRRYYLRKLGYEVERGGLDAYYGEGTKRNLELEARYKPFRFHPAETES